MNLLPPAIPLILANLPPPPAPRRLEDLWTDPTFLITMIALVAVILAGAVVIAFMARWRNKVMSGEAEGFDALYDYRKALATGELSPAEFDAIKRRLAGYPTPKADSPRRPDDNAAQ